MSILGVSFDTSICCWHMLPDSIGSVCSNKPMLAHSISSLDVDKVKACDVEELLDLVVKEVVSITLLAVVP